MSDQSDAEDVEAAKANAGNPAGRDLFSKVLEELGLDGSLFKNPGGPK